MGKETEEDLEMDEERKAKQKRRDGLVNTIWPTPARKEEFLRQSGRNPAVPMEQHMAHCLNCKGFLDALDEYEALPGRLNSSKALKKVREMAIRVSFTKAKKKENQERVEREQAEAKQKKKEPAAKKATGSSTSAAGGEKAEKMEVEGEKGEADKKEGEKKEGEKSKEDKEKKEKDEKDKPEATFDMLNNPARVMKPQLQVSFLCPVG